MLHLGIEIPERQLSGFNQVLVSGTGGPNTLITFGLLSDRAAAAAAFRHGFDRAPANLTKLAADTSTAPISKLNCCVSLTALRYFISKASQVGLHDFPTEFCKFQKMTLLPSLLKNSLGTGYNTLLYVGAVWNLDQLRDCASLEAVWLPAGFPAQVQTQATLYATQSRAMCSS